METENKDSKPKRKRYVRRRGHNYGSVNRPCITRFRMTQEVSSQLASIQGLVFRYGQKETLAELFEKVCMPALHEYVQPYAKKAREDRTICGGGTVAGSETKVV